MAAVTVTSDAVDSGVVPDKVAAGEVLCRKAVYTNSGAKDADSIIQMVPVVDGMQIVDIKVASSALGAARTLDIGDGDDVDRFFDGLDASAAIVKEQYSHGAAAGVAYEYTGNDTIDVKVLGDTLPDEAVITMLVFYKMAGAIADEDA